MKIKYALHGVDNNPLYSDFWEPVSKVWKLRFGITPVLLAVMNKKDFLEKKFDDTYGIVINIEPVEGVPTHLQAQWVRFWYAVNFPEDVCITSDIDMFPISKRYFVKQIEDIDCDQYVHLYSNMYPYLPVCYHVAKGEIFKKILRLPDSFDKSIKEMMKHDKSECIEHMGLQMWNLEEKFSSHRINIYPLKHEITLLNNQMNRVDRDFWGYDEKLIKEDFYVDCHSLRPYQKYKNEINKIVELLLR